MSFFTHLYFLVSMKRDIPLVWVQVIGLTGTLGICYG